MDDTWNDTLDILSSYNISVFIKRYLNEFLEAFIAYTGYGLLTNSEMSLQVLVKNIKVALILGALTFVLENYNPSYKATVKTGMIATLGSQIVKNNINH